MRNMLGLKIDGYKVNIFLKIFCTKRYRSRAGFTFLEVMVAVSIIAIVLVSVYRMHAQTISLDSVSRFYITAPMLAQKIMAELETKKIDDLSDDSGDFGKEFLGYAWRLSVNDVESEALGEIAKDLRQIEVTISFNKDEDIYSLKSYKFFR